MTKQELRKKAIQIKGRQYILVKDRIQAFNEDFGNGCITTRLVSTADASRVVIKATVLPDVANPKRRFTGYSQARWDDKVSLVNQQAAIENAETSAVGRALAMMGIGVIDSVASADEIFKAAVPQQHIEPAHQEHIVETTEKVEPAKCSVDHSALPVMTVKKEGANQGRKFVNCQACHFFKWLS